MKKRIFITLSYMSMFIIETIIAIGSDIFIAVLSIPVFTIPREDQIFPCVFVNVVGVAYISIMLYYTIQFFQWVDIDEKGISARNIVKRIHYKEWNQIREIKEV